MKRINMWSGPRNISTALMYSFAQRSDTLVVDEPFYAHYLLQSGAEHPGRDQVIESQSKDPNQIMESLLSRKMSESVLFLKNMAHHMIALDDNLDRLISGFQHIFLIRDPKEMLLSLDKTLSNPTLRDTAYLRQFELFEMVQSKGLHVHVVDARELLKDPKFVLNSLCDQLGLTFNEAMLSWQAGPISEDGVWAKYWYESVHQSTGFKPYKPKDKAVPDRLMPLYEQCKPIYNKLLAHAIKCN